VLSRLSRTPSQSRCDRHSKRTRDRPDADPKVSMRLLIDPSHSHRTSAR
jgi:hypothetical protein